ncbi:MAG: hypothetical protein ICV64_10230 [Thermoleophilia bacterium]|nr:hypothetical protein [Thermoleophilia bacterium]
MADWRGHLEREERRYRDGEAALPDSPDERQRALTRLGNAAYGAGLAALMLGDADAARRWLGLAGERWRESFEHAPPGSWGRPIGAVKARILAGDWDGAAEDARWALEAGAAGAESPIGRYAAALALLVLGEDDDARVHADAIRTRDDFPAAVGDALAMIAAGTDAIGYVEAVEAVLESFETRDEYLEDVPVADTVLVLQALAERRQLVAELDSPMLPR